MTRPPADAGGPRYRLRASVDPLRGPDGHLYFARAGSEDLMVEGPDPIDLALVGALEAGERTTSELACLLDAPVSAFEPKLRSLVEAGLAVRFDGAAPPVAEQDAARFSRQLPYLAEFGDPSRMQRVLRSTHVVVIGVGGLGAWVVASLCASGVGRLTLVDPDRVELSNLNRQILFGTDSIGRTKVGETARWIRAFDDGIAVRCVGSAVSSPEDAGALLDDVDLVVLVADWPPHDLACWVNHACMAAGVPFATAGQHLPVIRVGPTYVPGRTACFECHAKQLRRSSMLYDEYIAHARSAERPDATLGCTSGWAGSALTTDMLRFLLSGSSASSGAALIFDVTGFDVRREAVARDPECHVCKDVTEWLPRGIRPA